MAVGISAGPQGNPSMEPDGSLRGISAPVPATPATAALMEQQRRDLRDRQRLEDHFPRTISARDQAEASGARYGNNAPAATAEVPLPAPPKNPPLLKTDPPLPLVPPALLVVWPAVPDCPGPPVDPLAPPPPPPMISASPEATTKLPPEPEQTVARISPACASL